MPRICINLDDEAMRLLDLRAGSRSANISRDLKLFYASQAADKLMKGTGISGTKLVAFAESLSATNRVKLIRMLEAING